MNLINPGSAIVVADNSILTAQGSRAPGFVVFNLDKFENNMLRLDDWWLGSPFSKITDIAADALQSNTFFVADQGAKKIFRVRQLALHNFQITDVYSTNSGWPVGIAVAFSNVTSVEDIADDSRLPDGFALMHNYPNPFNAGTVIKYSLTESMPVKLKIFNVVGEVVRMLVDEFQTGGTYTVHWDGRDESGRQIASGIYFYKISAGDFVQTKKMILMQ